MRVLVRIVNEGDYWSAMPCWLTTIGDNVKLFSISQEKAVTDISEYIENFIENHARVYIRNWSQRENVVTCPEGYLELPNDYWKCKQLKTSCPVQAQVHINNFREWSEHCMVDVEKQKGIWNAIQRGDYEGFHHVPGRYLCGLCDNPKIYYNYHYSWELTLLSSHIDIESIIEDLDRMTELVNQSFPRHAFYSSLCCECFKKIARYFTEIDLSEYEIITYNYQRD